MEKVKSLAVIWGALCAIVALCGAFNILSGTGAGLLVFTGAILSVATLDGDIAITCDDDEDDCEGSYESDDEDGDETD